MADSNGMHHSDGGPGPNLRRRELGRELRKLRNHAGMSVAEIAKFAGLTETTIRRIESGSQTILPRNVRMLCQAYDVGAPLVDHLMKQAEDSNERGWWAMYSDTIPNWFDKFVGFESDAEELWNYSVIYVDGLLQTPEYAEAFFELRPNGTGCTVQRLVELRQARQERIHRADRPTRLHVVLDEAALRRKVGGTDVMRGQLRHLVESADRPNITIQVVPFDVGAYPGAQSPFFLFRFPEGFDDMDAVYLENQRGAIWMERRPDIKHYKKLFEQMTKVALTPEETAVFMDNLASSL